MRISETIGRTLFGMQRERRPAVRLYLGTDARDLLDGEMGMLRPMRETCIVMTFMGVPISQPFAGQGSYAIDDAGQRVDIPLPK